MISPYHYRLDWLAWFAGFQPYQYQPWTIHLVAKLLQNDEGVLSLLGRSPFEGAPDVVRIDLYKYEYSGWGEKAWWKRKYLREYLPALTLES